MAFITTRTSSTGPARKSMPEGPSIFILKEETIFLEGQKVLSSGGYSKIDHKRLNGKKITGIKSWGKHYLICFDGFYLRIHLMMFGSYRINERKEGSEPALRLVFKRPELNFYTCSVKMNEGRPDEVYDWTSDLMSPEWNARRALKKLRQLKAGTGVCDVLLDQEIFSGSGNIIKNEVLHRIRVHPYSTVDALPAAKLRAMAKEAPDYSRDFYTWKKQFVLRKHWMIYKKPVCGRCGHPSEKEHLGKGKRLTFFCSNCQVLYG